MRGPAEAQMPDVAIGRPVAALADEPGIGGIDDRVAGKFGKQGAKGSTEYGRRLEAVRLLESGCDGALLIATDTRQRAQSDMATLDVRFGSEPDIPWQIRSGLLDALG